MTGKRKLSTHVLVFAALSVALLSTGCGKQEKSMARHGDSGPLPVDAMVIHPQQFDNSIYATGTLLANEEVELKPEVSGRVVGVFFEEGKRVHQGDTLVKLNDEELQAQLKRKQLEEKLSSDEAKRKKALLDINGISREDYDRAQNALDMIKAEREVIESQLAKTEIVAPFDGVIGLRYVSEGSFISSNTRIATIQDLDSVKVEFSVPEKHARQLHAGTNVLVQVGNAQTWREGKVYAVEAKVDPATRTIKARAIVSNSDRKLIPGSFCKVEITLERYPDAIIIPSGAVIPQLEGEYVYVSKDGQAQSVKVTTGVRTDRDIQITEGLSAGDTLITTGLLQLTQGRAVQLNLATKTQ